MTFEETGDNNNNTTKAIARRLRYADAALKTKVVANSIYDFTHCLRQAFMG